MKKRWLFVIVIFFVVVFITGCGGGEDSGDNSPLVPRIKELGFAPISEAEYTERITIALDEATAAAYPDWQANAQIFNNEVNAIFARTTKKRYEIANFGTYRKEEIMTTIHQRTDLFVDNGWSSDVRGTTVFVFIGEGAPSVFLGGLPLSWVLGQNLPYPHQIMVGGQRFLTVLLPLNAASVITPEGGPTIFRKWEAAILSGYLGDLIGADRGNYKFSDLSGTLPDLGTYDFGSVSEDPMMLLNGINNGPSWEFSNVNSLIIDKNANYQYPTDELTEAIPSEIKIRVLDNNAIPAEKAAIRVYGILTEGGDNVADLLKEGLADQNGEAFLETAGVFGLRKTAGGGYYVSKIYRAIAVKAELGGAVAGEYITLPDLQLKYLKEGKDVFNLSLNLQ